VKLERTTAVIKAWANYPLCFSTGIQVYSHWTQQLSLLILTVDIKDGNARVAYGSGACCIFYSSPLNPWNIFSVERKVTLQSIGFLLWIYSPKFIIIYSPTIYIVFIMYQKGDIRHESEKPEHYTYKHVHPQGEPGTEGVQCTLKSALTHAIFVSIKIYHTTDCQHTDKTNRVEEEAARPDLVGATICGRCPRSCPRNFCKRLCRADS